MSRNETGSIWIVTLIVGIVALVGVAFFMFQRTQTAITEDLQNIKEETNASPTPAEMDDVMSDWETYSNDLYHYQFQYPTEATLSTNAPTYTSVSYMGQKQRASGKTQTELFDGYAVNVADVTGDGFDTMQEFLDDKQVQLKDICSEVGELSETTIGGKEAYTQQASCLNTYTTYYVQQGESFSEITPLVVGDEEDTPGYQDTVDKIISSFMFTK